MYHMVYLYWNYKIYRMASYANNTDVAHEELMEHVLRDSRYKGKHVVVVAGKVFTAILILMKVSFPFERMESSILGHDLAADS